MPDFYIDAIKGPKFSDVPMQAGAHYYLRAGQTHSLSTYRFLQPGATLERFGDGPNPIVSKMYGGDAWVYVRGSDVSIRNITVDANAYTGPALAIVSQKADAPIVNVHLANVMVCNSPDHHGLYIAGVSGGSVRDVLIEDCKSLVNGWHGSLISGDVQRVTYRRGYWRGNAFAKGGHGASSWSDSPAVAPAYITYDHCEFEDTKDVSLRQIEGQGVQADDFSSFVSVIACVTRGNAGRGVYFNKSNGCLVRDHRSYQDRRGALGASSASFTVDGTFVAYK